MQLQMAAPRLQLDDVEKFLQQLKGSQLVTKRGLMQKAELLLKTVSRHAGSAVYGRAGAAVLAASQ